MEINSLAQPPSIVSNLRFYSQANITTTAEIDESIVTIIDRILGKAIAEGASHLYFEPQSQSLQIRMRCDGLLQGLVNLPQQMVAPTITYLKAISGIADDSNSPQLGSCERIEKHGLVKLELTTLPTPFGDSISVKIIDCQKSPIDLDRLIDRREIRERIRQLIQSDRGLILVTGDRQSNKATVIAACLAEIARFGKADARRTNLKIYAIDSLEFAVPGIERINLPTGADSETIARTIQFCLHHQPDILAIGEISSLEIAQAAVQAVDRGCLVFATMSATSVGTAIARSIELGVAPARLYSATLGAISCKSIAALCLECRQPSEPSSLELAQLGNTILSLNQQPYYRAQQLNCGDIERAKHEDKLCPNCHGTGYRGAIAMHEVFPFTNRLKSTIIDGDADAIDLAAQEAGMRSFLDLAIPLFRDGKTTLAQLKCCVEPKVLLQNQLVNAETDPDAGEIEVDSADSLEAALYWKQQALQSKSECDRLLVELETYQQEADEYEYRIKHTRSQVEHSTRAEIALQFLSLIDVIELARTSIKPQTDREAAIQKGYTMLEAKMLSSIKEIGVRVTECQGHKFDSRLHEVVQEVGTHDYPAGVVISEHKRGYTLGDRVLRLAQVKVAVASNFS